MSEKITTEKICQLQGVAKTIRKNIVKMITEANSGHPGGSLSATDILVYLYFNEMNVDSSNPQKADRDRFVLCKGHAAPVLYATLAEKGFFPKEELMTLRQINRKIYRGLICLRVH